MYFSLTISIVGHALCFILLAVGWGGGKRRFEPPVVYSVTFDGGKQLGGISQVPKTDKAQPAPPKKVVEPPKKTAPPPKKEDKPRLEKTKEVAKQEINKAAEAALAKKQKEQEAAKKAAAEKQALEKKAEASKTQQLDDRLQQAVQRYMGESTDARGQGFGAGRVGGSGMGGGIVRPPEFFIYRDTLIAHLKEGWKWHDSTAELMAQVELNIEPDGRISKVVLSAPSGSDRFDDSIIRAVHKASPAPPPPPNVYQFFKNVRVTFDPRE